MQLSCKEAISDPRASFGHGHRPSGLKLLQPILVGNWVWTNLVGGLLRLMSNWCQAGSCHSTHIKLADLCAPDISIWYDIYDCFLQQTRFEINVNTPINLFFQFPKEDSFGLAGYLRKWGFPPPGSSKLTSQSGILWAPKRSLCLTKECKRVMTVLARIW